MAALLKRKLAALSPFAEQYARLINVIEQHCRELDDEQLAELRQTCWLPTQTNCGWAIFGVAPLVADAVSAESYRRSKSTSGVGGTT